MSSPLVPSALRWHTTTAERAAELAESPVGGLTTSDAQRRLKRYGPNQLAAQQSVSALHILLDQCRNILFLLLLLAAIFSAVIGHTTEAVAIAVILLLAMLLGFAQEYRAERSLAALRTLAAPRALVRRDGQPVQIAAAEVVPGDRLIIQAGDRIAADVRLVTCPGLRLDEAALTGESVPVDKTTEPLTSVELPMADQTNMAFAGTLATYGRGEGIVVATGMQTEFGRIAHLLDSVPRRLTPLQETLHSVGQQLAKVAIGIIAVIVTFNLIRGERSLTETIILGIALAVAVVPEALPAVVTVSLAIGVQRMASRRALVRHLPAVETLGCTTVICTDKTGTLTRDEMTVRRIVCDECVWDVSGTGYEPTGEFSVQGRACPPTATLLELLRAGLLSSDARLVPPDPSSKSGRSSARTIQGDPTEGALVTVAAKAGLTADLLFAEFPRVGEIPFSSETKRMTTVHRVAGVDAKSVPPLSSLIALTKGAPEVILARCQHERRGQATHPLSDDDRQRWLNSASELAGSAMRVLAIATRDVASADWADSHLTDDTNRQTSAAARGDSRQVDEQLTLLGLVGMMDPPRDEARVAIERCRSAGIRVAMITGDHPTTALAIARELRLTTTGRVVDGNMLDRWDDRQLAAEVATIDVYARVSPEHKLRIVAALQSLGDVVAMTGDGVNDAPALRQADIGIAMGITGTDVSREAAEMTLTDDNFASIVAAIEEGRAIYANIGKYLLYLLSSNLGEITLMSGAALVGLPLPLTAVQILYINLATDGFPALALAVDPPPGDLMEKPPRRKSASIFNSNTLRLLLIGGISSALLTLSLFIVTRWHGASDDRAMTMTFVALVLIEFLKAYNFRTGDRHIWYRPWANRWLNLAILWELLLLCLIVHTALGQRLFATQPLTSNEWLVTVLWAAAIIPCIELGKLLNRFFTRRAANQPQ